MFIDLNYCNITGSEKSVCLNSDKINYISMVEFTSYKGRHFYGFTIHASTGDVDIDHTLHYTDELTAIKERLNLIHKLNGEL